MSFETSAATTTNDESTISTNDATVTYDAAAYNAAAHDAAAYDTATTLFLMVHPTLN